MIEWKVNSLQLKKLTYIFLPKTYLFLVNINQNSNILNFNIQLELYLKFKINQEHFVYNINLKYKALTFKQKSLVINISQRFK